MVERDILGATRAAYDAAALTYARLFRDELRGRPLDRAILGAFAEAKEGMKLTPRPKTPVGGQKEAHASPRTQRHAITLVVAAALALTTGACAQPGNGATLQASEAASITTRLENLYEQINGTPAQRAAVEQLTYVAYQGAIQRCMRAAGYSYTPPPFRNPYAGMTRLRLPSDLPALITPGAADHLAVDEELTRTADTATTHANPGYEKLSDAQKREYADQVTACEPPTETYVDAFVPPASLRLDPALLERLRAVQRSKPVANAMGSYPDCMSKQGVPAVSLSDLETKVRTKFNGADDNTLAQGSAAWTAATAFQDSAIKADATCRHNAWIAAMTEVEPELSAFTGQHKATLEGLSTAWRQTLTKAEQARPTLANLSPGS